jgi:multiple sugar transport system substrate-binding protein
MFKRFIGAAVLSTALFTASAMAKETVVWWDFLGGGDGVRMKQMIADFNKEMDGKVEIQASTLDWGVPFYTKVQTSSAVGEAPDIMTYHASRIPLAVKQGILQEITADDFKAMSLGEGDFAKATWDAVTIDGKQYAVPLDTHPIVLYYNKDILAKAGLLGADGKPTGLNGADNFKAALGKAKDAGAKFGIAGVTADGNFMFRTIYSMMCQQGG